MKFSKSSNTFLSIAMITAVIAFSVFTYIAISLSMKDIYMNATTDMIGVATENIEEHIDSHVNECIFITKTTSFMRFIQHYDEATYNSADARSQYTQTFDYVYTKAQNSQTINKIMYVDDTRKILLSSDTLDQNTYLPKMSYFSDVQSKDITETKIQKNNNGRDVIIIAQPVKLYDRTVGTLYMEINFDFIDTLLKNYKFGKSGNLFLITNGMQFIGYDDGNIPVSVTNIKDHANISSILLAETTNQARIYQTQFKSENGSRYMIYTIINEINAVVASSISKPEVNQTSLKTAFPMLFLMFVIFTMLIVYRYIISKKILHPLALLNRSMYMLQKGDLRARYNYNAQNEFGNLSCVFNQTIASLQSTTLNLRRREARNAILLDNVTDVIWEYNIESGMVRMPENWSKLLGIDYANADYMYSLDAMFEYIHFNDRNDLKYFLYKSIESGEDFNLEVKMKRTDDSYIWVRITGSCMYNEYNEPDVIIGSLYDITLDKQREDSLKDSATRDDMTNLLKKVEMERQIDINIGGTDYEHSLIIIDLDSFKQINDTYGHLAGDQIIIFTADTLREICGDDCYLCRFGGDEFIVYTESDCTIEQTEHLAAQIIKTLNAGCVLNDGTHISVFCSIGMARSPKDGSSYVELIDKADLAIYYVKKRGKNQFMYYNPDVIL